MLIFVEYIYLSLIADNHIIFLKPTCILELRLVVAALSSGSLGQNALGMV